ncbi:hypothetical protein INT43_005160 [Umbelopsis isabellina]|uniref:Uncharacterized protein n=1 Tax=Mortierella isabellina TaxID=91625 RepID=A0A8H7PHF1_MORIS|nr:hypothetical protein INT43_005160 [Umbelopsis isabellina]
MIALVEPTKIFYRPLSHGSIASDPPSYSTEHINEFVDENAMHFMDQDFNPQKKFSTFFVPTQGQYLESGFHPVYPGDLHYREITEEKWYAFLQEINTHAKFVADSKTTATTMLLAAAGLIVTRSIRHYLEISKHNEVEIIVQRWNQAYFNLQGVHITLLKGDTVISKSIYNRRRRRHHSRCAHYYLQVQAL